MILSELLSRESVLISLEAASRDQAFGALVDALPLPGCSDADRAAIKSAVQAREAAGPTGIGNGVAIPHARTLLVPRALLAIARLARPLDMQAADGRPVTWIFLLAIPAADPRSYLPVLAALSRLASDEKLLRRLRQEASPGEVYELLAQFPLLER